MDDLSRNLQNEYGLKIKNIYTLGYNYLIHCEDNKKVLKRINMSAKRILFVHSVKEHLINKGIVNIDRYTKRGNEELIFRLDNKDYILSDLIEGRECNFNDDSDLEEAIKMLALIHKASIGFLADLNCSSKSNLGFLPSIYGKRLDEIKKFKKIAKNLKSKFDILTTEYINHFQNIAQDSIYQLSKTDYFKLVEIAKSEGRICHNDYSHNNIIFNKDEISVINFESCIHDLKIYDLANIIRRKMRKCSWDTKKAINMIDIYNKYEKLSVNELLVLKIMLQFPQKFWRILNKYYNSRKNLSEDYYLIKLKEAIDEIAQNSAFLKEFSNFVS